MKKGLLIAAAAAAGLVGGALVQGGSKGTALHISTEDGGSFAITAHVPPLKRLPNKPDGGTVRSLVRVSPTLMCDAEQLRATKDTITSCWPAR